MDRHKRMQDKSREEKNKQDYQIRPTFDIPCKYDKNHLADFHSVGKQLH